MAKAKKTVEHKELSVLTVSPILMVSILPSKNNPRKSINEDSIKELADSMQVNGLLQPITIRPDADGFEIVAGERRWRAAKLLRWETIPAIVRHVSDEDMLEIQVLENLQREDMSPLDEALAFQTLLKKESLDWLSSKIHKSKKYVLDRIKLNDLCLEAKLYLTKGVLPLGHAVMLSKIKEEEQEKILKGIITIPYNDKSEKDISLSYCFKTLNELKSLISSTFSSFSNAPFSLSSSDLIDGVPSCNECDKRTCNQNLLFGDITSKDECTDVSCFKSKIKAHVDEKIQEAKYKYIGVQSGESDPYASCNIKVKGQSLRYEEKQKDGLIPVVITKADNWRQKDLGKTVWVKMPEKEEIEKTKEEKSSNNNRNWKEEQKELFYAEVELLNKILPSVVTGIPKINRSAILDDLFVSLLSEIDLCYIMVFAHSMGIEISTEVNNIYDYIESLTWGEKDELKPELIKSIWGKCNADKDRDCVLKVMSNLYYIGKTIDQRDSEEEYEFGILTWKGYSDLINIDKLINPED